MSRRVVVTAVAVLLAAAAVVAVRSSIDTDFLRTVAEDRLTRALGQPVSIGQMSLSLFPLPAVAGSDIRIGGERDTPDMTLARIRVVPRLGSLVSGPYVIRELTLEGLSLRIVRDESGQWRFPAVVPVAGTGPGEGASHRVERVRLRDGRVRIFAATAATGDGLRETSSIDALAGDASADGDGLRVTALSGRVGSAALTGEATVTDAEARLDVALSGIGDADLDAVLGLTAADPPGFVTLRQPAALTLAVRIDRRQARLTATGSLRAPELDVYSLRLANLEAPIRADGSRLAFAPSTFALYGGSHHGTMTVDLARTPARWTAESRVTSVDVGDLLRALAGDGRVDGTGAATASFGAVVSDAMPQGLDGRLQVTVADGVIRDFPLLATLNRALRLAEGDARNTAFERLTGTFVFRRGAGHATTDDLVLTAREVRVEARGRVGFSRSLDLEGLAIFSPERSASAVRSVRELSALRNARGELEVPLGISGTLDDPSFAIDLQAALGRSIKEELRRRIRDLFRRGPGSGLQ